MKHFAIGLLAGVALFAQGQSAPKSALDKTALEAYLRYSELWIPQVEVKIDDQPWRPAVLAGAHIVRVHAVAELVQVVRVAEVIRQATARETSTTISTDASTDASTNTSTLIR